MSEEDRLKKLKTLKEDTEEEYLTFINATFKNASVKSELKRLAEEFLLEFYSNPEKREKLSFNQGVTLYTILHKNDNDFANGVLTAITKKESGDGSAISKILGGDRLEGEKPVQGKVSEKDVESAKRVLSILDEVKELAKSEKNVDKK